MICHLAYSVCLENPNATCGGTNHPLRQPAMFFKVQTLPSPGSDLVYQIVSTQPGLVPQEKGQMTRARIWGATVFVYYASRWVKIHLMQDATGDLTLEAKNGFEQDCMTRNVEPKHYHADNGRFAENSFKEDCVKKCKI